MDHAIAARVRLAGFTLMEVMVVILIIGLLMAIAVPSLRKARESSRISRATAEVEMLRSAIDQLAWDTGLWPGGLRREVSSSAELWDLTGASAGLLSAGSGFTGWKGPYIGRITADPWGKSYFFAASGFSVGTPNG
jgi:general secretion pathway protein G